MLSHSPFWFCFGNVDSFSQTVTSAGSQLAVNLLNEASVSFKIVVEAMYRRDNDRAVEKSTWHIMRLRNDYLTHIDDLLPVPV
jgi:hypothetical protein